MKRKSAIAAVTAAALALSLAACGSSDSAAASSAAPVESTASSEAAPAEAAPAGDFDTDQDITVISREDGSGTRGAFIELTGVEEKNADGKKVDNTTEAAAIQSSTNGVMTAVANDETAIGYISLGSLNDTVKAVTVGGVAASAETVKDGSYVLARPFNIVTNGDATDPVAVDFIAYVLSKDGQALATDKGYIGEDGADFTSAQPAGKITVGGVDIADMPARYVRENVGVVLQEPFLYSRTIMENIRMIDPRMSEEQVHEAARIACVHDVIEGFENGYDTVVGERGVTLSGGQKQRVAIARMLMQNAPILIFDDSMSAVDTETDASIRAALKHRRESTTTFIISHRITTLCEADKILVLEHGKLVEQGTHEELIAKPGLYRRIARIQNALEEELKQEGGGSNE